MGFSVPKGPASPGAILWGKKKEDGNYGSRKAQRAMAVALHATDIKFFIPNAYFPLAWEVTKQWHYHSRSTSGIFSHRIVSLFNHAINMGTKIEGKEDHEDLTNIWFKGTTVDGYFARESFLQNVSKYVKAGSYINWEGGEPWSFWQWYFNGDCMIEKKGRIIYE